MQEIAECCVPRLEAFRKWIGVATLRSMEVSGIPDEMQVEPINCKIPTYISQVCIIHLILPLIALILRVLHRLHFLSEQMTFDVATYSYLFPLLKQILLKGGIGLTEEDDPLEQVALALDLIKFHCGECKCHRRSPTTSILFA